MKISFQVLIVILILICAFISIICIKCIPKRNKETFCLLKIIRGCNDNGVPESMVSKILDDLEINNIINKNTMSEKEIIDKITKYYLTSKNNS